MPVPRFQSPDYSNAFNMIATKKDRDMARESQYLDNAIKQKQLAGGGFEDLKRTAEVIKLARDASTKEEADAIINMYAPDLADKIDINPGKDITMRMDDGTEVTIPPNMQDVFDAAMVSPENFADREKMREVYRWGARNGMSIKRPEKKAPTQSETERLTEILPTLKDNDPRKKFYQDRLTKLTTSKQPDQRVADDALVTGMRKMFGETDLYGLDETKAKKALDAANRAKGYMKSGMERIPAMEKAFNDVQGNADKQELLDSIPDANPGLTDFTSNMDETKEMVKNLKGNDISDEMIEATLIDRGWDDGQVAEIMGKEYQKYPTKEDVKKAYDAGKIDQEEALGILRKQFGMK